MCNVYANMQFVCLLQISRINVEFQHVEIHITGGVVGVHTNLTDKSNEEKKRFFTDFFLHFLQE